MKNLKELDANLRVCPNLSKNTVSEIFNNLGKSTELDRASSSIEALPALGKRLSLKDFFAVDLKVTDVSQEVISFCRASGYGLMACERQGMTSDQLKAGISSLYSAARDLPIVVFKANNVAVARALLSEHIASPYSMISPNLSFTP